MRAEYKCKNCEATNNAPKEWQEGAQYVCRSCGGPLERVPESSGEVSAAVGMVGGAALGAAAGGIPGGIIGAVIGALVGKSNKGLG